MKEQKQKFIHFAEILPQNATTAKILKAREEIEAARAEKDKAQKLAADKEEKDRKKREREQLKEKEKRDRQAAENAKKEAEEQEESKRLEGRMLIFLRKAKENQTPRDISLSGLELGAPRTSILSKIVAFNSSLTCLHLARKKIQDKEGQEIARMLLTNKTLRKLELEGNCLGMQTARVFALALRVNTTLRFLDLESNNLTHESEENTGVDEMISALAVNKTLLSLNLANNKMDEMLGRHFVDCLANDNKTLIDFEFGMNNFRLDEIRKIQDLLKRNKRWYNQERLKEWEERKLMANEDSQLQSYYLKEQTVGEQTRMTEEAKEQRKREIDKFWKARMQEQNEDKKQTILQLMEAAQIRAELGKKKKRRGRKKK